MDIHAEWRHLMGRNAGEILAFTTDFVRKYWNLTEREFFPGERANILDDYRKEAVSDTYHWLTNVSAEFILEQTGIQMPAEYLLKDERAPQPDWTGIE